MTKFPITYVTGDATQPIDTGSSTRFICHICNDEGKWGAGFVLAISKRHPGPERQYRNLYREDCLPLGTIQICEYTDRYTAVVNMIAQRGVTRPGKHLTLPPVRYHALTNCFLRLMVYVRERHTSATFHMPRIGCGLAGGKWELIEPIIKDTICKTGPVFVYDLPTR